MGKLDDLNRSIHEYYKVPPLLYSTNLNQCLDLLNKLQEKCDLNYSLSSTKGRQKLPFSCYIEIDNYFIYKSSHNFSSAIALALKELSIRLESNINRKEYSWLS